MVEIVSLYFHHNSWPPVSCQMASSWLKHQFSLPHHLVPSYQDMVQAASPSPPHSQDFEVNLANHRSLHHTGSFQYVAWFRQYHEKHLTIILGKLKLRINLIPWQLLSTRTTMTTESSLITSIQTQTGFLSPLLRNDEGPQKRNFPEILLKTKSLILKMIIVRNIKEILRDSRIDQARVLPSTERSSRTSLEGSKHPHLKEIGWDLTSKGRNNRSENLR